MNLLYIVWRLLRYRVAVILIIYMLLSLSLRTELTLHYKDLSLAAVALLLSYTSATSVNDLADRKIDAINHPKSYGRPLITGGATTKDLWQVFFITSALSLVAAFLISSAALGLLCLSILCNVLYSLKPIRLSYRTFFAPLALGIAYVGIPFSLGIAIYGKAINQSDYYWFAGLYLMFVGRIILKDFRDRAGDKKYNKPTFLLRFGKGATCAFSFIAILAGGATILSRVYSQWWLAATSLFYLLSILKSLHMLYQTKDGKQEQINIGIGAKMGNGFLLNLLGVFMLKQSGAVESVQMTFAAILAIVFLINYLQFLREPEQIILGYKG